MAKIIRREWTSSGPVGRSVKHVSFGYTLTVNGKRERKVSSAWTSEEDALKALSERQQQIRGGTWTVPSRPRSARWSSGISPSKLTMESARFMKIGAFLKSSYSRHLGQGCRFGNSQRRRYPATKNSGSRP
jgi:hypothetical protein